MLGDYCSPICVCWENAQTWASIFISDGIYLASAGKCHFHEQERWQDGACDQGAWLEGSSQVHNRAIKVLDSEAGQSGLYLNPAPHLTTGWPGQATVCFQDCFPIVEVLVVQLCPTLWDPMNCSPPGSSVDGILQARILEWVRHSLLQGIFLVQGSNPGLLHCKQILYHLNHQRSPTCNKCSTKKMKE